LPSENKGEKKEGERSGLVEPCTLLTKSTCASKKKKKKKKKKKNTTGERRKALLLDDRISSRWRREGGKKERGKEEGAPRYISSTFGLATSDKGRKGKRKR